MEDDKRIDYQIQQQDVFLITGKSCSSIVTTRRSFDSTQYSNIFGVAINYGNIAILYTVLIKQKVF